MSEDGPATGDVMADLINVQISRIDQQVGWLDEQTTKLEVELTRVRLDRLGLLANRQLFIDELEKHQEHG